MHITAGYARADERRRRVHLTGPEATGGKEEYGLEVAGTWARHVERILSPCRNGFGEGRE